MFTRRRLMIVAGQTALAGAMSRRARADVQGAEPPAPARAPTFCLFSKHLPALGWSDLGRAVRDAGFDGVDLTVRSGGHVLPARAEEDLPRAIAAIRAQGLAVPMITTELTSAGDPGARPLLKAAASSGVRFFKTGYWHYVASNDVRAELAAAGTALGGLAALARECGIEMGFHNHSGYIGAALWDIAPAIDRLDPRWTGYYYDPRHAVAEGGGGAWKAATRLVASRLKMVAVKDFFWMKTAQGWRIEDCPIGQGQVDWTWMGSALRDAKFEGPISVHLEYDIPASTSAERTRRTLEAAARDLAFARRVFA
jgi:L-ribulose-5-phosphate 3-epimerase